MCAYSVVPTVTTGDLWTAANHNTYIKDNFAAVVSARAEKYLLYGQGYNITDSASAETSSIYGLTLPDTKLCVVMDKMYYPWNYSSSLIITPIVVPSAASGNIYSWMVVYSGADTESVQAQTDGSAVAAAVAVSGANTYNVLSTLATTVSNASSGDILHLYFRRDATNAADTLNATAYFAGFLVEFNGTNYG